MDFHTSCFRVSDVGICPHCHSKSIIKNGHTKTQKQQYLCKNCHKRFLDFYTYQACLPKIDEKIVLLIKEGLGIRSIARVLKISPTTLLKRILIISSNIKTPILSFGKTYEIDEMRFFIRNKNQQYWLIYAIERATKKVVSFNIGKRTNKTLNCVIQTLKNSNAKKIYTDKLKNYSYLIPRQIHFTQSYQTNHIERKNLTIRTHLKRFHRKTICFSRTLSITRVILLIYFFLNSLSTL